jgi:hypothetical protein
MKRSKFTEAQIAFIRKRPANPAFRIAAARENVRPLTGKLRGSYDDGYGSSRS